MAIFVCLFASRAPVVTLLRWRHALDSTCAQESIAAFVSRAMRIATAILVARGRSWRPSQGKTCRLSAALVVAGSGPCCKSRSTAPRRCVPTHHMLFFDIVDFSDCSIARAA